MLTVKYPPPPAHPRTLQTYGIYAGCVLTTTAINTLRFEHVGFITDLGAYWHFAGALAVIVAIPIITMQHADANWVFTAFETQYVTETYNIDNKL